MGENAMKTTNGEDIVFAWSEEDCRALGIERRDAILAWKVLSRDKGTKIKNDDLPSYGYDLGLKYSDVVVHPNYLRALRVMTTQYTNAICLPAAIRVNLEIAEDVAQPAAARVKAAGKLMDYAEQSLDKFRAEFNKGHDELPPEDLARVIKYLESLRAAGLQVESVKSPERTIDVQSFVQPASADAYLADLL